MQHSIRSYNDMNLHNNILMALLILTPAALHAQDWDISIGTGLSFAKLLPVKGSTKQTSYIRYNLQGPDIYLSPELAINAGEHSRCSFSYQYTGCTTGIRFKTATLTASYYELSYLHNFNVGYYYHRTVWNERAHISIFAKAGLACGSSNGTGESGGGSSGTTTIPTASMGSVTTYAATRKLTAYEVMDEYWMPNTTLGFTAGPISPRPAIGDRLVMSVAVTMGWKNIYTDYSKLEYAFIDQQSVTSGIVKYQGMPLLVQVGACYRLFRLTHQRY